MDTFKLKVLAITLMLIDHIGAVFISPYSNYWLNFVFRAIGRLAFPIFVFLIVEGFNHTRSVKKYLIRLGAFALISEIPFDLAFYHYHNGTNAVTDIKDMFHSAAGFRMVLNNFNAHQNVFFTLFLGLLLITLMSIIDEKFPKKNFFDLAASNTIDGLLTVAFCAAAFLLRTDYDVAGILLIVAFYLFRGSKSMLAISTLIIMGTLQSDYHNFFITGNVFEIISTLAALAIIPIGFYNGEKGKNIKYFFYIFYPAHLFCLFLINILI